MKYRDFNPKTFTRDRVYTPVSGRPKVSKLWIWNIDLQRYEPPPRGKQYFAKKSIFVGGRVKQLGKFFSTIQDALIWQAKREDFETAQTSEVSCKVTFGDALEDWRIKVFNKLQVSTRLRYTSMIQKYFERLKAIEMQNFGSLIIDDWIAYLLNEPKTQRRVSFKPELDLLSGILKHYGEYSEKFVTPIKARHRKQIVVKIRAAKPKSLSVNEFNQFLESLKVLKDGQILSDMATVQYYQALRISEVAALEVESVKFDKGNQCDSRLQVTKSVIWLRTKNSQPIIVNGFKNSSSNFVIKEQPLFPLPYLALKRVCTTRQSGLLFLDSEGKVFSFRTIQQRYNTAFKNAGLPYTSTHVLRHGGCRNLYNMFPDLGLAKQLLGNSDIKSVMVYAQRNTDALNKVANLFWDKATNGQLQLVANSENEKEREGESIG